MTTLLYARFGGPVTSFRYPCFVTGRQPSYALPPLPTVRGLLAAACGSHNLPGPLNLGYLFHAEPYSIDDLETLWFISNEPRGAKISSNILRRELRVQFKIELFIQSPNLPLWARILRSPRHCLSLGRSQDILSVEEIKEIQAERLTDSSNSDLYVGPGLYPISWKDWIEPNFTAERMPAYIPPVSRRPVLWGYFLELTKTLQVKEEKMIASSDRPILVPTKIPGASKRLVYLWPIDSAEALVSSLCDEWPSFDPFNEQK